jgi:serine/threonine protein kinase
VFPSTDLYAVGGIAYQMLTGRIPHEAPSAIEVISQKMKGDPAPPRQWVPSLDEDLDSWVMMLLEREPERRPESADDARRMLRRLLAGRTRADARAQPAVLKRINSAELLTSIDSPASPGKTYVSSNTPEPRRSSGSRPPENPAAPGPTAPKTPVAPSRQWSEAKTVLIDPVVVSPPQGTTDSTAPGNATILTAPAEKPRPVRDVDRTQPAALAVEMPAVHSAEETRRGSGRTVEDDAISRSKLPFVVIGLLVIILVVASVLLALQ